MMTELIKIKVKIKIRNYDDNIKTIEGTCKS